MINRTLLGGVTLLACAPACTDFDALSPVIDDKATASSEPTVQSTASATETPAIAGSGDCGSSSGNAGSWPIELGEEDPLTAVSLRMDGHCNLLVATAHTGVRRLDASGHTTWVRPFGSIVDVTLDGVVYVAGTFSGELTLDASTTLVSSGGSDAYIAILDANGDVISATALGGAGDERAENLAVAANGDVVVSGAGLGTTKLDAALHAMWQVDLSGAVAAGPGGATFVTGALVGSATFGGTTLASAGGEDVLVAKLTSDGAYEWARSYGDAGAVQHGQAIAVDGSGNVLVSGVAGGSVDFGGGPITVPPGTCPAETWCEQAAFVVKLDGAGGFVWSRSRAPARAASAIAVGSAGDVFVSGSYPGGVPPYRIPLLASFGPDGAPRSLAAPDTAAAGHGLAVDGAGDVFMVETSAGEGAELGHAILLRAASR
jgi:hypothetical protein